MIEASLLVAFCCNETCVFVNSSNCWEREWEGERCEQRLIAKPFPKVLSRSVSCRAPFERQFVYC